MTKEIFRTDYMVVRDAQRDLVAVQVGRDPDKATPTLIDPEELVEALNRHLLDEEDESDYIVEKPI